MVDDLQRVFIHEMGHFIASEMNYKIFNYDRRINSIILTPRKNTAAYYDGWVKTDKATIGKYSHLTSANEYAQIFYGCLFEVLFRNISLNKCLCGSVTKENHLVENIGNGRADNYQMLEIGRRPEIKNYSGDWYEYISNDYFNLMLSMPSHFEKIFKTDVYEHILEKSNTIYSIDINKLLKSANSFIESHSSYFESLLNELYNIQGI